MHNWKQIIIIVLIFTIFETFKAVLSELYILITILQNLTFNLYLKLPVSFVLPFFMMLFSIIFDRKNLI